jgi:hypothetical protein
MTHTVVLLVVDSDFLVTESTGTVLAAYEQTVVSQEVALKFFEAAKVTLEGYR